MKGGIFVSEKEKKILYKLIEDKAKTIRRRSSIDGWIEDESCFPECAFEEIFELVSNAYQMGKTCK